MLNEAPLAQEPRGSGSYGYFINLLTVSESEKRTTLDLSFLKVDSRF